MVIVPVLSNAIIFTLARVSRCSAPLTRRPDLAAFERAQKAATGVERTSAQGHALTKTTNAKRHHSLKLCAPIAEGTITKQRAIAMITVTKKYCSYRLIDK